MKYLFVGERPSPLAMQIGATWRNGRLAGATLHDALRELGLNPHEQRYTNLRQVPGLRHPGIKPSRQTIFRIRRSQLPVVALGKLVSKELTQRGIPHKQAVHPAARGRIRKKERYIAHLREVLGADT